MKVTKIQVVENSDRFHVSVNEVPVVTLLFGNGISKPFSQMNANSEAYKIAVDYQNAGHVVKLIPQAIK